MDVVKEDTQIEDMQMDGDRQQQTRIICFGASHKRDVPKVDEEVGLNLSWDHLVEYLFI